MEGGFLALGFLDDSLIKKSVFCVSVIPRRLSSGLSIYHVIVCDIPQCRGRSKPRPLTTLREGRGSLQGRNQWSTPPNHATLIYVIMRRNGKVEATLRCKT